MARLPYSVDRLEQREINLRRDKLPVRFSHPVRGIDDYMDDIIYNVIDVIQEKANDHELRTFYYNLMSRDDWRSRDFEQIVGTIADIIDIGVQEGKYRDVRDAIVPIAEDLVTAHIGYMTEEYPSLMDFVDRSGERGIDKAVDHFIRFEKVCQIYRDNDYRLDDRRGSRGRGRDRDERDRYERDDRRDSRRGTRRDEYNRDAMRGGVHGSPRRKANVRNNTFAGNDQSDRFEDNDDVKKNNRDRDDDRSYSRRDDRERDINDRYSDSNGTTGSRITRKDDELPSSKRSTIQHLPGRSRAHTDIEDALSNENNQGGKMSDNDNGSETAENTKGTHPVALAFANRDAWTPSAAHPHPFVFNHRQDLFYELDFTNNVVVPLVVEKKNVMDYWAHDSMAFGKTPKDFKRFDDHSVVQARLDVLHGALLNPSEEFDVEGSEEGVTYFNRADLTKVGFSAYTLKENFIRLSFARLAMELNQTNGDETHKVQLIVGRGMTIEAFATTIAECDRLEELRGITSFTKLREKLHTLSRHLRPEIFLQLDSYFTKAVNRMLRQNLSIPSLHITSFCDDWLDLYSIITSSYGDAYRDAINTHQAAELRVLLQANTDAELHVLMSLKDSSGFKPFVLGIQTKLMCVEEVGFHLDLDMVPDVASQLLPENNAFFHDLSQDMLTNDAANYGRFFVQTSDGRVIEASRSFMNDKAIMLRMIQ